MKVVGLRTRRLARFPTAKAWLQDVIVEPGAGGAIPATFPAKVPVRELTRLEAAARTQGGEVSATLNLRLSRVRIG